MDLASLDNISIKSPLGGGAMTGSNPTVNRSKLGTKRHILTDNNGIPLSVVISSANTHDLKLVLDMVNNAVIKRHISSARTIARRTKKTASVPW